MKLAVRIERAIRRRWGIVRQLHWPAEGVWRRTPDGLWMFLKPGDFFDECYAYASPDESYRQFMPLAVHPGDWGIDVGAQKGWYSMLLARGVGSAGHVLSVEPDPAAAELMRANLERNRCANVTLVRAVAGEGEGDVEFVLNDFVGWSSRTPNALQRESEKARVTLPMRPLDDMLAACAPPAGTRVTWVKIDVEGGEAGVLRGATRLLAAHAPVLWMEVNPSSLEAANSSPAELGALLQGYGYQFWRGHVLERWLRRPRVWFSPVARLADVTDEADVLCVPPSRPDLVSLLDRAHSAASPLRR
ncbi:MAG: FkbM family methyltransferase [Gemmatimonadaceae bacterium]|nr:FkbM family methyltransferase [Gemmatimonadaceae bacterium]